MCVSRGHLCNMHVQYVLPPCSQMAVTVSPEHGIPMPMMCGSPVRFSVSIGERVSSSSQSGEWGRRESPERPWFLLKPEFAVLKEIKWHSKKHKMTPNHPLKATFLCLFFLSFFPVLANHLSWKWWHRRKWEKGNPHSSFSFQSSLTHLWPTVESVGRMCARQEVQF